MSATSASTRPSSTDRRRGRRHGRSEIGLRPDQPWIAFLGTIEPTEEHPRPDRRPRGAPGRAPGDAVLVLSGARGWDEAANCGARRTRRAPHDRPVIEAGYLPLEFSSAFLGGSELVVYPSLGEGFGLPVLEAMSAARPC